MITGGVSVVIPYYNGRAFIERAIQSIQSQTALPSEIIVVDDGSDPPLPPDFAASRSEWKVPVRVVTNESNMGIPSSRNAGVSAASRKWIAFLDQDDEWLPHKLQVQSDAISAGGKAAHTTVYYGRATRPLTMDRDRLVWPTRSVSTRIDRSPAGALFQLATGGNAIPFITVIVARDALLAVGGFDNGVRGGSDDYAMMMELAAHGYAFRLADPSNAMAVRNETGSNYSNAERFLVDDLMILERLSAEHPEVRSYLPRALAAAHYRAGRALMETRPADAMRHIRHALHLNALFPRALTTALAVRFPESVRRMASAMWNAARRVRYRR